MKHGDALNLFYQIYVDENVFFCAKLPGIETYKPYRPVLQRYDEEVRGAHGHMPNFFTCFKILEEMAYYSFDIDSKDFTEGKVEYRGNIPNLDMDICAEDFVVDASRLPLMMDKGTPRAPKTWFEGDIFPIYEGDLCENIMQENKDVFAKAICSRPWKDLRPFEDCHRHLLNNLIWSV